MSGLGFQLRYDSIQGTPLYTYRVGECGGSFTTRNGIFSSPSHPENYPHDADCVYTIQQPNDTIIVINFHSMDIQDTLIDCGYKAALEIRDGPAHYSPLIDNLCGNKIPAPIQSKQNQLWMR